MPSRLVSTFLKKRMEPNNSAKERRANKNPLPILFTKKSISGLNPDPESEKLLLEGPIGWLNKSEAIALDKLERNPK